MAVDLGDLIDPLKREVNPLGGDSFPNATDDQYLGYLEDAFWQARLDGINVLAAWDEADAIVTPVTDGGADITRDLQQLIVLMAGMKIIRNELLNTNTLFRAQAGPVEFETQQAASLLTALLSDMQSQLKLVLLRLSDVGVVPSYYFDSLIARETSMMYDTIGSPSAGYGGVHWSSDWGAWGGW